MKTIQIVLLTIILSSCGDIHYHSHRNVDVYYTTFSYRVEFEIQKGLEYFEFHGHKYFDNVTSYDIAVAYNSLDIYLEDDVITHHGVKVAGLYWPDINNIALYWPVDWQLIDTAFFEELIHMIEFEIWDMNYPECGYDCPWYENLEEIKKEYCEFMGDCNV